MLNQESCEACRADAPTVGSEQAKSLLGEIPDWQLIQEEGVDQLMRQFKFRNFVEAMAFANEVGELAESEGHHPKIIVEWGRVQVFWWTHKIRGLHRNDFIMAARTDGLLD